MNLGENISDFFSRTIAILNKMRLHGEKIEDVIVNLKILIFLSLMNYKSNVECHRCHRYDHYKFECRTNLNKEHGEKSNFVANQEEEIVSLLIACHAKKEVNQNMWYLDTSCNNHICGDKFAFSELDESFRNTVKFGENYLVSVMGKGNVTIRTKENTA
ncbi:hypothetical protein ACOSP7_026613 [Xanthoceras sorbifolium]